MSLLDPVFNAMKGVRALVSPPAASMTPQGQQPPSPTSPPAAAPAATTEQADDGWTRFYSSRFNAAKPGQMVIRAKGEKGGKYVPTYDGMTEGQFMEKMRAEYEGGLAGGGGAVQPPPVGSNGRGFTGLGNRPAPTSSVAPAAATARLDSARSAVQGVKAAEGIRNTASGTTVIAGPQGSGPKGAAYITPTRAGGVTAPKVLASPYGAGSVVQGPRTTPARINPGNTYDPFFHAPVVSPPTGAPSAAPSPSAPAPAPAPMPPPPPVMATNTQIGGGLKPPGIKPLTTGADTNPALASAIRTNVWEDDPRKAAKKSLAMPLAATR